MLTNIQIKGVIGKISGNKNKDINGVRHLNVATNIYEFNKDTQTSSQKGTIWTRFVYRGDAFLKVGMPIIVEGHLAVSKNPEKDYILIADKIMVDLDSRVAKENFGSQEQELEDEDYPF